MKRGLTVLVFLMLVASMSFVFATSDGSSADGLEFHPTIDLKATADSIYVVKITDALTANPIKTLVVEVGQTARENAKFGTNSEMVNVAVFLIDNKTGFFKNGTYIDKTNAGTFITNELIFLDVANNIFNSLTFEGEEGTAPIDYTPEVVEENVIEEVVEEIVEESEAIAVDSGLTGQAVGGDEGFFSRSTIIYLIAGLVLVAGGVVFLVMRRGGGSEGQEPKEPRVVKLSEMRKNESSEKIGSAEQRLAKAEQELRNARAEINNIKNKTSELSEAEEEFKKAKEKLDGLKGLEGVGAGGN